MKYEGVILGIFSRKLNRFVGEVFIHDKLKQVHIKNTGRLKEILHPGVTVALEKARNPKRKTRYSIIAAMKGDKWVNIDSQVPNLVVYDAIQQGLVEEFEGVTSLKREAGYEGSRFDLFYYRNETPGFIEVKGVTLENAGVAMFPDAPTLRGTKHVETLVEARNAGYEATVLFVIQMKGCHTFIPNREMDPSFADALAVASANGVEILAYDCHVTHSSIRLDERVPVSCY